MARRRKFDDGGGVREGRNENIGDDTRAKAMEYIRRKQEREGREEDSEKPSTRTMPASKPAPSKPAKPAPAASDKSDSDVMKDVPPVPSRSEPERKPGMIERAARAVFPNPSSPGSGIEDLLPAVPAGRAMRAAKNAGTAMAEGMAGRKAAVEAERAAANMAAQQKRETLARTTRESIGKDRMAARDQLAADKRKLAERRAAGKSRRDDSDVERMEGEAPAPIRPARSPEALSPRSSRERSFEEEVMQGEGGRYRRGGMVKKYAAGGSVSASRRADGIAKRGKTKGRIY